MANEAKSWKRLPSGLALPDRNVYGSSKVAAVRRKTWLMLDLAALRGSRMRKLATYEGIVENGRVTLPPNIDIPDKTHVYVLVPDSEMQRPFRIVSPHLAHPEQGKDFEMQVIENTSDASL